MDNIDVERAQLLESIALSVDYLSATEKEMTILLFLCIQIGAHHFLNHPQLIRRDMFEKFYEFSTRQIL
jgi:hypothetical protein